MRTPLITEKLQPVELHRNETAVEPRTVNIVFRIRKWSVIPDIPVMTTKKLVIQNIYYIMSNDTYMRNRWRLQEIGRRANITITNYNNDNDYLSFLFSFYYRSSYVAVMNIATLDDKKSVSELVATWIADAVDLVSSDADQAVVSGELPCSGIGLQFSNFLFTTNVALRRMLTHTSLDMSSMSLFSLLPAYAALNSSWTSLRLPTGDKWLLNEEQQNTASALSFWNCPALKIDANSTITVFLRLYQRHYLQKQLEMLMAQSVKPDQIVIIQNRNLTQFRYDFIVSQYKRRCDIYYIWNVNWNSFFHLSYLVSSVVPTTLSFTFDDDQLLSDLQTHAKAMEALSKRPGIYSLRQWCWCKKYLSKEKVDACSKRCGAQTDLVVNPFFTFSAYGKFMWRYDIPMYFCCEEMSYLLSSSIECGIQWYTLPITYSSFQHDQQSRDRDEYTQRIMKMVNWTIVDHLPVIYYTRAGYKPEYPYDSHYVNVKREIFPVWRVCSSTLEKQGPLRVHHS